MACDDALGTGWPSAAGSSLVALPDLTVKAALLADDRLLSHLRATPAPVAPAEDLLERLKALLPGAALPSATLHASQMTLASKATTHDARR